MPYFKDQNGGVHFLSDEDIANGGEALLPVGCVEITDAQAQAIQNPTPTSAQKWTAYQATAKAALEATSSTMERIVEGVSAGTCAFANADVVAFMNYRKSLRAILAEVQPSTIPTALPSRPAYPAGT